MARRDPNEAKGRDRSIQDRRLDRIVDSHAYGGLLLLAAGFYFVYAPLALIVPGLILAYLGFIRWAS